MSVATLVRLVFRRPEDGAQTLALERRATLISEGDEARVDIKCQPFGGAVRIRNLHALQDLIGDFHFDSERSRFEQDFRVFIRPSDWEALREFCLLQFSQGNGLVIESEPSRELAEEFFDVLGIELEPQQYTFDPLRVVVENEPSATDYAYARGHPTVRLYRVFEARILDAALCRLLVETSERWSNHDLRERARQDAQRGGKGWANKALALPMKPLVAFYWELSPDSRNEPVCFAGNTLDSNVCAILEGVSAPRYQFYT